MGRRNRFKQDDGDELESYERDWLSQRANDTTPNKRQKLSQDDKSDQQYESTPSTSKDLSYNDADTPTNTSEQDKIDRLKLKKQRQKERRKEKQAAAAAAREAAAKQKEELQKVAQLEKQQQIEKKKKSKEKHSTQSFRTLHKGVKCLDLVVGKGQMVQHRKKVRVSYTLRAKSHTTGKILDSSQNFGFRLGKGAVIQGWDIGLEGMKVGGVRRLIVPPLAGYGNKDVGAGRGADLFFEIELLHVAP